MPAVHEVNLVATNFPAKRVPILTTAGMRCIDMFGCVGNQSPARARVFY